MATTLTTPLEAIKIAMRLNGRLDSGVAPTDEEQADFLQRLNIMLSSWATKRYLLDVQQSRSYSWGANVSSRTIGPAGDFVQVRPIKILDCQFRDTSGADYPVNIIPKEQYDLLELKSVSGVPYELTVCVARDLLTLYPYYIPSAAYTILLYTLEPWGTYATVNDAIGLPPEYHSAICYNLSIALAPELGVQPTREIILTANEELMGIKNLRCNPPPQVPVARMLQTGRAAGPGFIMSGS